MTPKIKDYILFKQQYGEIKSIRRSMFHWGTSDICSGDSITYNVTTVDRKKYKVKFLFSCNPEDENIIGYELNGKKVYNDENKVRRII